MAGRLRYFTVLICCVLLVGAIKAVDTEKDIFVTSSQRQPKAYVDHLYEVSETARQSNNPQHIELLSYINDYFHNLYISTLSSLPMRVKSDAEEHALKDRKSVISMTMSQPQVDDGVKLEENANTFLRQTPLHKILDILENSALNQNTSSTCIHDIARLIISLFDSHSQKWAISFFDATGKPGPSLTRLSLQFVGNYDQCLDAAAPPDSTTGGFKGSYFRLGLILSIPLIRPQMGACLPDTCSSADITSLMQEIVKGKKIIKVPILAGYGVKLDAPTEMTPATIAAISILSTIGLFMIIGTFIDVVIVKSWKKPEDRPLDQFASSNSERDFSNGYNQGFGTEGNNRQSQINDDSAPLLYSPRNPNTNTYVIKTTRFRFKLNCGDCCVFNPSNIVVKIFLAFSVYSNGKKLLSTDQKPGSVGSIHGIRFISMSWVVLCHWYAFSAPYSLNSPSEFPNLAKLWSFMPIMNGYASVDTFFTLSGILTSYITIREMRRRQTATINWFVFYFHRFWRLTPPYMLSILTVLGLSQYMGSGPLWNNVQPGDKEYCEKYWWTNLLYVNNLVKSKEMCFGHSWYLANDMQFFIVSPLMLVPFYFSKFYGLLSCFLILLGSCVSTGVLSMIHKWPTNPVSLHPNPDRSSELEWFNHYYIVPWCRIGPFVIGIVAGYVLAVTKGRNFRMRWGIVAVGWIVSIACGWAVVYGVRGDITGDDPSSLRLAALYNAVSRASWGACVCWVVVACSAGYGGPVNAFLSWSPFVVLGRLTYLVYLIHLCVGGVFFQNLGALMFTNDVIMVATFIGVFTCVNAFAFVCVLALESPMLALESIIFKRDA